MGPKYEFTDETTTWHGHLLHRIKRLSDGQLGGWIEKESNLSQIDACWVADDAYVYDDAYIYGNAKVYDNAEVYGNARIFGHAQVYGDAEVYDEAKVNGSAKIYDEAIVYGSAEVFNSAQVYNYAQVSDKAKVYDYAIVFDNALVFGNAKAYDNVQIYGGAKIYGDAEVFGKANIWGVAEVYGNAKIYENASVCARAEIHGDSRIYGHAKVNYDVFNKNIVDTSKKPSSPVSSNVVQDFIYKIDDSQQLMVQTEYNSISEFFSEPIANDIKLDTVIICAVDTKKPIIKLEKAKNEEKTIFKFIVDITNDQGEEFMFKSIIKSQEQLDQLVQQTVDALRNYPQFIKYIDDLENCL